MEIVDWENPLREKNEIDQIVKDAIDKVPPTPLLVSSSNLQSDNYEVVVPCEEGLVEARITKDIRKTMGFKVNNEMTMLDALAKVPECQDFVLPRRRDYPRKNKGHSID